MLRKQLRGRKWRICVFEKWPGLQILEATRTSQVFPCFHLRLGHLYTVYICIQVRPNCQLSRHSPYLSLTRYLERVIASMCFTSFRDAKFLSLPLPPAKRNAEFPCPETRMSFLSFALQTQGTCPLVCQLPVTESCLTFFPSFSPASSRKCLQNSDQSVRGGG